MPISDSVAKELVQLLHGDSASELISNWFARDDIS